MMSNAPAIPVAPAFAAALLVIAAQGCVFYENVADLHSLNEGTVAVLVAHAGEFRKPDVPYDKIPPGKAHWIAGPGRVARLLGTMDFEPVSDPPKDPEEMFALVFIPDDPSSRTIFFLDRNLNLLPGFRQHGVDYGGEYYRTSDEFKMIILSLIEPCPQCREYLPSLGKEWPEDGTGGRR